MIEMTSEVRSWIEQFAGKTEPREDEYVDPADGLLHCKVCSPLVGWTNVHHIAGGTFVHQRLEIRD